MLSLTFLSRCVESVSSTDFSALFLSGIEMNSTTSVAFNRYASDNYVALSANFVFSIIFCFRPFFSVSTLGKQISIYNSIILMKKNIYMNITVFAKETLE